MTETKLTIGKAIDQIIEALQNFEGNDRTAILSTVCQYLQIKFDKVSDSNIDEAIEQKSLDAVHEIKRTRETHSDLDIRTLREQKNPNSARQMACLVAYYLQEVAPQKERKDSISAADLEKYFKQANYKLPKHIEQLLVDSKSAGYFDSSKRGEYALTRVGYNLVAHSMPGNKKG